MIRAGMAILLAAYLLCLPDKLFHVPYATVVTDRNGELLGARIADDQQWRFPPGDTVPDKFNLCITEFEDRYFRYHWGVNPVAIGRALLQNIRQRRIVSGGSTLTMQVIRLARNKKRTVGEKIIEMILATRLEFRYSKEKILALYASHAPFGGNVVGLDAAAWRYFGHPAGQLSWAEAATLAVLPNAPARLHLSRNRPLLLEKRNRLLKRLLDRNRIDKITYELALSEDLPAEPLPLPAIAPHLVARYYQTRRGEQIQSTIDKNMQVRIEDLLEQWRREFLQQDIRNAAAIVIDIPTNEIVVYCGNVGFDENSSGNQVDIIRSERSTGSILKPFLYYVALQEGEILPRTLLPDIPININGFTPQNFNRRYEGAVAASEAVARSLNVPLVNLLRQYGVPKFYDFLKRRSIAILPHPASHYGLSLILGGAEAQLGAVTSAYAAFGRSLLGLESAIDPAAAWQVLETLKEVNRPEEIDWRMIPTLPAVAWKTGTSHGFRDAWAIGVTPRYAVGVWVGNSSGEGKPNLIGARTAGPVLFDIFDRLPSAPAWFQPPEGVFVAAEVCRQSGHLKSRFCEEVDTVLVVPKGLQTAVCPYHVRINLTPDERYRVYENCLGTAAFLPTNRFVLPPSWAWYYRQHHPEYQDLPPLLPGCGEDGAQAMQFIYPQGHAHIRLPKQMDGSPGKITLELAHVNRNATVFWHIDGEYVAETTGFHTLSTHLPVGSHTIIVVDNDGNTLSCRMEVDSVLGHL
ncbi:MAG: penicillin-binding protein 1C [Dysgonamonadaceae bacterium]|jgi:penicillin-binding protein 1C|nr:penicillin-binding protein 1C [Dysgonamonadaceae bacterium]